MIGSHLLFSLPQKDIQIYQKARLLISWQQKSLIKYQTILLKRGLSIFRYIGKDHFFRRRIEGLSQGPLLTVLSKNRLLDLFRKMWRPAKRYSFVPLTAGEFRRDAWEMLIVAIKATVNRGSWPLGKTIDQLVGYDLGEIVVAAVPRKILKSPIVNLKRSKLPFL